jgi:hypothetical protein
LRNVDSLNNLVGPDVMSKTILVEEERAIGELRTCENVPLFGADRKTGLSHPRQQETDRCASRRLLR